MLQKYNSVYQCWNKFQPCHDTNWNIWDISESRYWEAESKFDQGRHISIPLHWMDNSSETEIKGRQFSRGKTEIDTVIVSKLRLKKSLWPLHQNGDKGWIMCSMFSLCSSTFLLMIWVGKWKKYLSNLKMIQKWIGNLMHSFRTSYSVVIL